MFSSCVKIALASSARCIVFAHHTGVTEMYVQQMVPLPHTYTVSTIHCSNSLKLRLDYEWHRIDFLAFLG